MPASAARPPIWWRFLALTADRVHTGPVQYVIAVLVVLPVVALVAGSLLGRVTLQSCCAPADPRTDLRMRAAFDEDPAFRR